MKTLILTLGLFMSMLCMARAQSLVAVGQLGGEAPLFMYGSEYDDEGNVYCWDLVNTDGVYDMDPSEGELLFSLSNNGTYLVKSSRSDHLRFAK